MEHFGTFLAILFWVIAISGSAAFFYYANRYLKKQTATALKFWQILSFLATIFFCWLAWFSWDLLYSNDSDVLGNYWSFISSVAMGLATLVIAIRITSGTYAEK
ncbi:hypothetical protein SapgrDRAFT_2902 [Saprospira grandis DSM 2844]|uniref:Uncharacterized protein n=1 Tax=Saprospira grandis DSM 2844 TaxID=694433 RepID=J0P3X6_9BACT|nr:hypothetical protein [Saprospira grandis]EJF54554.1 hypothetical protein SapgrDRAFT_2902 [Saprospira grandis DSM 2844]